jgi:hypothetical protein
MLSATTYFCDAYASWQKGGIENANGRIRRWLPRGADLDEISGGLSSFSEKLRRRGYKPDLVFSELKSDLERLKKDGTLDLLVMLQKGRTLSEANSNTANSKDSTA